MGKAGKGSGFILCFLANLLLNCEWGLIALLLWAISYWFGFSWYYYSFEVNEGRGF